MTASPRSTRRPPVLYGLDLPLYTACPRIVCLPRYWEAEEFAANLTRPGSVADFCGILVAMLDLAAGDRFHGTKPAYDVKLSVEELHRIALWLDCLSVLYGV